MANAGARRTKIAIGVAVVAAVAMLLLANAHLVYVATTSQPDCVPHLKASGSEAGAFRAAQSSC